MEINLPDANKFSAGAEIVKYWASFIDRLPVILCCGSRSILYNKEKKKRETRETRENVCVYGLKTKNQYINDIPYLHLVEDRCWEYGFVHVYGQHGTTTATL
jgi:hypothetical protein